MLYAAAPNMTYCTEFLFWHITLTWMLWWSVQPTGLVAADGSSEQSLAGKEPCNGPSCSTAAEQSIQTCSHQQVH